MSYLQDLGLLFSLVFMGMLVFGSLLYYCENGMEDTGFYSIPQVDNTDMGGWAQHCRLRLLLQTCCFTALGKV